MDRRDAVVPPIRTTSTFVLSGVRVSSGAEKSPTSTPAIEASSLVVDIGKILNRGLPEAKAVEASRNRV
jgi:hypothetical protein